MKNHLSNRINTIFYSESKLSSLLINQNSIGIITNNSFLNGLTHRKMREKLKRDFDEIYILNLHGSSRIGEKTEEGKTDENVFDIMQGVSISLFVKKNNGKECRIFYYDLFGKRKDKEKILKESDIKSMDWEELPVDKFNSEFRKTRWGNKRFINDLNFFVPVKNMNLKQGTDVELLVMYKKHNGDFFVTIDFKDFIKGGKKEKLEEIGIKVRGIKRNELNEDFIQEVKGLYKNLNKN